MKSLSLFCFVLWLLQGAILVTPSHIQECPTALDIIFMIDSSQTMQNREFSYIKAFLSKFIPHLNPSTEGTHVGILSFASSANVEHSLSDNQDAGTLQKALERVLRFAGSANTLLAFNEAQRQINVVHGGKQHKRRQVLVFASNGQYPYPDMAVTAAQQAKDNGIIIISLAANVNENKAQLESVATSKRHVVIPQSLSDTSPMNYLVSMICEVDRKPAVIVSYSAEGSALKGHVIDTVHVWDDFACAFSCLHTKNCFSFNFKESSRVCELNHSNKMTSPKDLSIDVNSNYYELVFS